jgi:hypothetical protein
MPPLTLCCLLAVVDISQNGVDLIEGPSLLCTYLRRSHDPFEPQLSHSQQNLKAESNLCFCGMRKRRRGGFGTWIYESGAIRLSGWRVRFAHTSRPVP